MKELNIEQKANLYDEVVERANNIREGKCKKFVYSHYNQTMIEYLFPEFKESEDEKTKRILHSISKKISFHLRDIFTEEEFQCFDAWSNAWLEKQGESIKIKKGKNYLCIKTHKYAGVEWIEGVKYYSPEDYSLVNQGCTCYCPKYSKEKHNNFFKEVEYDNCLEKQGEQEHVIAPKFSIGDTIRNKITNEVFTITYRCVSLEYYSDINHSHEVKFSEQDDWELVNQKPVVLMFRAGDKVRNKKTNRLFLVHHVTKDGFLSLYDIDDKAFQGYLSKENFENYELVEQKFADNVEPKFKVGDIIIKGQNSDINKFGKFKITCIKDGRYWYNEFVICEISEQDKWELVKIEPKFKDGDWVIDEDDNCAHQIERV